MMDAVLFFLHYSLLLVFGVVLSAAFAGIFWKKEYARQLIALVLLCGGMQLAVLLAAGENLVWKLYPLITHLPLVLALHFGFRKRLATAFTATATAYLCCQPANWFGMLVHTLSGSPNLEMLVRILALLITGFVALRWLVQWIAPVYAEDAHPGWVFGIVPVVYYLFDYFVNIYTSLWLQNNRLIAEFMPLFLCMGHITLCAVYYREYQRKNEAEQKEQLLRITMEQQAREMEAIRRGETQTRILRHDLKLFLSSLSACVENGDKETARELITGLSDQAEAPAVKWYCSCDMVNYVLSDYAERCREREIAFTLVVSLTDTPSDPLLFATILANALDNALNAQKELPVEKRQIRVMLKSSAGKILLSVKNPCARKPEFASGMPVSTRSGHGYGTRSIRYAAEKLGGNCQFAMEEDCFLLRVII